MVLKNGETVEDRLVLQTDRWLELEVRGRVSVKNIRTFYTIRVPPRGG